MTLYRNVPTDENLQNLTEKQRNVRVFKEKYGYCDINAYRQKKIILDEHRSLMTENNIKIKNYEKIEKIEEIIKKAQNLSKQLEEAKEKYIEKFSKLREAEVLYSQASKNLAYANEYQEAKEKVGDTHKRYEELNTRYRETIKDLNCLQKMPLQRARDEECLEFAQFIRNYKKQEQYKNMDTSYKINLQLSNEKAALHAKEIQRKEKGKKIDYLVKIAEKIKKEDFSMNKEYDDIMQKEEEMDKLPKMIKYLQGRKSRNRCKIR